MLAELKRFGLLDEIRTRNRALDACASYGAHELAEEIAAHDWGGDLDVVAFNTLMKCYAQAEKPQCCLGIFDKMCAAGLSPTEVTLGILLNSSIEANDVKIIRHVYSEARSADFVLNVVHYTTFIKGLCRTGHLEEAIGVLDEMSRQGVSPDVVTYTIIIKGHTDRGDVKKAFLLMEQMLQQGLIPDNFLFHNLLHACSMDAMEPASVHSILDRMLGLGMMPSAGTLSLLLKAFIKSESWSAALKLLKESQTILGVHAEVRAYIQLIQACSRASEGDWAVEVYQSMVSAFRKLKHTVDELTHKRIHQLCSRCGKAQAAAKIYNMDRQQG